MTRSAYFAPHEVESPRALPVAVDVAAAVVVVVAVAARAAGAEATTRKREQAPRLRHIRDEGGRNMSPHKRE